MCVLTEHSIISKNNKAPCTKTPIFTFASSIENTIDVYKAAYLYELLYTLHYLSSSLDVQTGAQHNALIKMYLPNP